MDRLVFYFTGTGNSMSVAKVLADGGTVLDIGAVTDNYFAAKSIGFVFPVYCNTCPKAVKDFVFSKKIDSDYVWAVATCGGSVGNAIGDLNAWLIKQSGKGLSYGASLLMPDNCIIFSTTKARNEVLLGREEQKVQAILKDINAQKTMQIGSPTKAGELISKLSWFGMKTFMRGSHKTASDKCIGCGLCAKLCPSKNIVIKDNRPIFGDKCEYCFGCLHFCPNNAVRFGFIKARADQIYHHPSVSASTLIQMRERRDSN